MLLNTCKESIIIFCIIAIVSYAERNNAKVTTQLKERMHCVLFPVFPTVRYVALSVSITALLTEILFILQVFFYFLSPEFYYDTVFAATACRYVAGMFLVYHAFFLCTNEFWRKWRKHISEKSNEEISVEDENENDIVYEIPDGRVIQKIIYNKAVCRSGYLAIILPYTHDVNRNGFFIDKENSRYGERWKKVEKDEYDRSGKKIFII